MLKRAAHTVPFLLSIILTLTHPASGSSLNDGKAGEVIKKVRSLQVPFVENRGQVGDERVKYYAKTFGGTVFITEDGEIVYSLPKYEATGQAVGARRAVPLQEPKAEGEGWVIREAFVGATISEMTGEDPAATRVSYFKGNDPAKWKTSLPTYNVVSLGEIYPGIDLKLKAYGNNMEKLFHVKPGADPGMIKIRLGAGATGESPSLPGAASGLSVNDKGELEVETGLGVVKFTKPLAYQEEMGRGTARRALTKTYVEVSYAVEGDGYTFKVDEYDRSKVLVIDPLLASTFIGGSSNDRAFSVAMDSSGNVYVAGDTYSPGFPTTIGAYDATLNGSTEAFVSKLDGSLTTLLASTFLGGSSADDARSIAIGSNGNIYMVGNTQSSDFPTTPGAYDTTFGGDRDSFISKLDGGLTTLLASTFLGGSGFDSANSITMDSSGNIYVAGSAGSSYFPTTAGAYDTTHNGSLYDAFVARLDADLSSCSPGDPDSSGIVDILDIMKALRVVAGVEDAPLVCVDLDANRTIDILDVIKILRLAAGLE